MQDRQAVATIMAMARLSKRCFSIFQNEKKISMKFSTILGPLKEGTQLVILEQIQSGVCQRKLYAALRREKNSKALAEEFQLATGCGTLEGAREENGAAFIHLKKVSKHNSNCEHLNKVFY